MQLGGVIWQSNGKLPVDAPYLAGIDRDMARTGLRPLGWSTHEKWTLSHRKLPAPDQLQDPGFVAPYQPIASRLRTALSDQAVPHGHHRPVGQPTMSG
ncbi:MULTISPECIES: hypothetical protein [unclassified Streptomyces]|uniref:hypothetical protein n=1 Tax=unclassified Streptomyces TaxID=2593676 RepID=UPI002E20485B|nr:hypothetical protein OG217_37670 [Streptomyces sp. NBC_01023]